MRRGLWAGAVVMLLVISMVLYTPFDIQAATKPINKVSVRVSSDIEPGGHLPDIEIGSGSVSSGKVRVSGSGSKYEVTEAEWADKSSKEVKVSDEPRMKVTLEPTDVSQDYFLASYKKTDVKISGGTFVSARRDGDSLVVTLRLNPIKGDYDAPVDAYWNEGNLGEGRWEKPENTSGKYEVQLYRDGKSVFKLDSTSAVKYNFYPYMTVKGDYTFKVRTIPGDDDKSKNGKKSGWVESGELQITDRDVSDGKGQKANAAVQGADKAGWIKENDVWRYRYPDGNFCSNGWGLIDDQWYYFNGNGSMLTGWQDINGERYYLLDGGQMARGWNRINNKWYYFRPEKADGHPEGSMIKSGWRVVEAFYYYFNDDGTIYTGWLQQNNKKYYLNEVDNSLMGAMFTGWFKRDDKTYFADSNGAIVEGWWKIDGEWYYFYPGSGEMARNTDISGFHVDENGVWR